MLPIAAIFSVNPTRISLHGLLLHCISISVCLILYSPGVTQAQAELPEPIELSLIGGDLTTDNPGRFALQLPAPNVTSAEREATMLAGFELFHSPFKKGTGLGPSFINTSCGGCHAENGRGRVGFGGVNAKQSPMVVRVSNVRPNVDGSPKAIKGVGTQLQNHLVNGKSRYQIRLNWRTVRGRYPDGEPYKLRRPVLTFNVNNWQTRRMRHSLRMTPAVIGAGLLEAIPESWVLSNADPEDTDGNGISGRVNYVRDLKSGELAVGRFGFKALEPTLEQQSLAALFHDIGVTNILFNAEGGDAEFTDPAQTERLVVYQAIAGVPAPINQDNPSVILGNQLFQKIGCSDCHKMNITTGSSIHPELENQLIHPLTDLLLHDMGRGLKDNRREFGASGKEWRTTPLWGVGFSKGVSSVKARFLHDGRARSIEEAILWHDGEAASSRAQFKSLAKTEREAILEFLRSL